MYPQKMRMKRDTPLIAIKMDTNGHRRGRNRQIKRVTSKTPKSCRKTTSWSWCVKGEDQLARCAKNKLRVHHKAAIKSIKSHSEKIIATFPAPFLHEKLLISVNISQNVRKVFAKLSPNFRTHFRIRNCRFFVKLKTELSQNYRTHFPIRNCRFLWNCRKIIAWAPYISCSTTALNETCGR